MDRRIGVIALSFMAWSLFAIALVATVAATYSNSASIALLQHADFLYLPALYNDLVVQGGRLKDWALPPSDYFFPDFAVFALLRLVSANQDWLAIAAQVLVPTSIALIATHIARKIGSAFSACQTMVLLSTMLLAYAWHWSGLAVGLLCFAIHSGQIAMVLTCVALLLRPSAPRVALVCLFSFATAFSDPLFVMAGALPSVFLVWRLAYGWARWAKLACIAAANLGGLAVYTRLPVPALPGKLFDLTRSAATLHAFTAHLGDFDALPVYVGFGCAALAVVGYWRDKRRRAAIVALILSVVSALGCLLLIGAELEAWGSRYLISMHVILAILAPIGLSPLVKSKPFTLGLLAAVGTAAVLAVVGLHRDLLNVGKVRLAPMQCFDRFALDHPVHRCVASYWLAKPIAVLATQQTTVIQSDSRGVPHPWIYTRRHVREHVNVDCAVFNDAESAAFIRRFGEPQFSAQCEGARIMAYRGDALRELNRLLSQVLR